MGRISVIGYGSVNRYFTLACFGFPPVLGSVASIAWHGGAIWCTFEVLSRRRKLTPDRPVLILSLFMYLYVAANLLSAFVNGIERAELYHLVPLATFLMFPFSYSIWSISEKAAIKQAAIFASMVASYAALVLAMVQFHVYGMRAEGGSGNALVFALVACMAGAVCLAGSFSQDRKWQAPLLGAFAASLVAAVYSQSRLVWLAAAVAALLVLWIYRDRLRHVLSARMVAAALVLAVILGAVGFDLIWGRVELLFRDWNALAENQDYNSSVGLRAALWQIGFDLVRDNPVIGYGRHAVQDLLSDGLARNYGLDYSYTHFHNGVLTLLIEAGLIGALSVLAVFVLAALTAYRTLRRTTDEIERFGAAMLTVLVSMYLVTGMGNLIIGHDIIDAVLMIFLIVGTYLAAGTSMLPPPAGEPQSAGSAA
jgi:O-antigen ligase